MARPRHPNKAVEAAVRSPKEYDFALIIGGVSDLSDEVLNALFEAGCDDATFSIQYGQLYGEFSRQASDLKEAILSAIKDIRRAGVGAEVLRVDECDLVTPSEIARRIGRSRQLVHQYITATRGPGNFPPPACHLNDDRAPIYEWCAVSYWLAQNNIIRPEEGWNAEVVATVNSLLDACRHCKRHPELVREIEAVVTHS